MLKISLNRLICSTVVVSTSNKYIKGCQRLNTNHPTSLSIVPVLTDSQSTSASWIRWIACGWKNARSSSSVRHSRSCLSDFWDYQFNANPITVQCKVGIWFKITFVYKHLFCSVKIIFLHVHLSLKFYSEFEVDLTLLQSKHSMPESAKYDLLQRSTLVLEKFRQRTFDLWHLVYSQTRVILIFWGPAIRKQYINQRK